MKVKLISTTQNLLDILYTGARTCYNAGSPIDMFDEVGDISRDKKLKLINGCIKSNHQSILEHSQFTFAIEGVSRALTHQLVRHRHCSFSQQSQRYVNLEGTFDYVTPKALQDEGDLQGYFAECMQQAYESYTELINKGVKPEDARAVLPNACCTNMVITLNLRSLIHLCNERLCTRAQLEIRQLVQLMVKEVLKENEWLKPYFVPKCIPFKGCSEHKSCGYYEALSQRNK